MRKEVGRMNIGVLSLQGGFIEHITQIETLGHNGILVKKKEDLENLDAIILPGGESTTIGKLLDSMELKKTLIDKIKFGLPTFGTCAGMILLAKEVEGEEGHLKLLDVQVKRNAFGRQLGSFNINHKVKYIDNELELVFIRAPYVEKVYGDVEVLCQVKGKIVAVKQGNIVATAFHPELTSQLDFLRYFLDNVC